MKMVRIDDAIYDVLVANAAGDQRTIFAYTNRLLSRALTDAVDNAEPVYKPNDVFVGNVGKTPAAVTKPNPYANTPAPATIGYACCVSKTRRCPHWEHNELEAYWQNKFTGEVVNDNL
jgi:hypothetical protein